MNKLINFDDITVENRQKYNPALAIKSWPSMQDTNSKQPWISKN